ncbi:hypothetical protein V2J09_011704 [Rumex salicifolius]
MRLHQIGAVKIEKETAMNSYRRFKKVARTLELLFAAMFFSWLISRSSPYFSAIFQLSSLFLNRLSTLLLNHHFVFLLGNGIIFTLFLKFGGEKQSVADIADRYPIGEIVPPIETISCEIPPLETVSEVNQIIPAEIEAVPVASKESKVKKCGRSRSNDFKQEKTESIQLQRSETEPRRKLKFPEKKTAVDVDNLSNEEFQRRVEAFIAQQQNFIAQKTDLADFLRFNFLKIEKETAMNSYRRFKTVARTLEFLFAAMFFSWLISRSSPYFSAVFQLSGLFLNRLSTLLLNHHFVFLLGNGIIFTLFLKFGGEKQSVADIADEYLIGEIVPPIETIACEIPPLETVSEVNQIIPAEIEAVPVARKEPKVKKCRRSRSNDFNQVKTENIQLQRSETEPRRKLKFPEKKTAVDVDNLSNEEFQRRVDAFIAQQQKFLRDESLAIISS